MQRWAWCLVVLAAVLSGCRQEPTLQPIHLTTTNWEREVLRSKEPVLVDFSAVWCGPCQKIAPTVARVAFLYQGRAKVGTIDIDESPEIAKQFDVNTIPRFMVFKEGKVIGQITGGDFDPNRSHRDQLAALIETAL